MSSVSAKLAVSTHAVQNDNNNNCYFGSINAVQTILKGITDEFASSVNLENKAAVVEYVKLAESLGSIHYKKYNGNLQDKDISDFSSKYESALAKAGLSNIAGLIANGKIADIIAAIKAEAAKSFEDTTFFFNDDLLLYFKYIEISAFLENYPDKNACVKPEILENVDKLKGDLNQEDISYSNFPDKLYATRLELKNRFGFAFYYTMKRETLKSLNSNVDLFLISNQGKEVLHLTKISIVMDKDFNVDLVIVIDSNVQKIRIIQNCNEFLFVTGSIEKEYDSYKFHISVRQFLSNRRDQIKTTLSPEQIEGALIRTTDIIKSHDIKRVNEIRCSDDPIEVQQDEIETVTQLTTVEILQGIRSLVDDCKVTPPECDYIGENGACIKCVPPTKLYKEKFCIEDCPEGFYVDEKAQACIKCDCPTCISDKVCTSCEEGELLYKGKCYDQCPVGTVQVNGPDSIECIKCAVDCVVCLDKDTCKDCGLKLVHEGKCVDPCPSGTYPNYGIPPTCESCTDNCLICIGKNDCEKCETGYYEYEGKCIKDCPAGTFADQAKGECIDCPIHCKTCTEDKCTECKDNYVLTDKGTCEDKCPPGTVKVADNSCAYCEKHCEVCLSNDTNTCIKCDDTTVLRLGDCPENCKSNEYVNEHNECKPCSLNCAVCPDNTTCNICNDGYKLLNNVCVSPCPPGYYESGSNCLKCDPDSNCKTCDGKDNGLCIVCLANQVLGTDGKCADECKDHEYEVSKICHPCPTGCQNCDSNGICTDCISPKFIENGKCVEDCSNGYHADKSECYPCQVFQCLKCTDDKNICDTCKEGFKLSNGICIIDCPPGTVNIITTCRPCTQDDCDVCPEQQVCKECKLPLILQDDGSCKEICKEGQFENSEKHCENCKVDNCIECPNNPECDKCKQGTYLYENSCGPCPMGTIPDDETRTCKECASPCKTCKDTQDNCTSCEVETMELIDGKCKYPCNEYEVRLSSGECVPCDLKDCKTCHPNREECIVCEEGKTRINKECIEFCPDGTRKTEINTCQPCRDDCEKCPEKSTNCIKCNPPFVLKEKTCVIECPPGYTLVGDQCKRCEPPCKECNSNFECIDCPTLYVRHEGQCLHLCPSGTYVDVNHQCPPCEVDDCGECKDLGKICEKCKLPKPLLYNNNCVDICPDGTAKIDKTCIDCEVNHCKVCNTNIAECNVCKDLYFLISSTECGNCPNGTYPNYSSKTCDDCSVHCKICNQNSCKECDTDYYLNKEGVCVKECEAGYVKSSSGACVKCEDDNCVKCSSTNPDVCLECKDGTYLDKQTKQCVTPCPEQTFPNNATKTCDSCPNECKQCAQDKCTECIENYHLENGKCKDTCPDGLIKVGKDCVICQTGVECLKCGADDTEKCLICKPEKILFQGECLNECPQGYKEVDKTCEKCPDSCKKCDETGCVDCIEGKIKQFGQCVELCGLNYFEQNNECHHCETENCLKCDNTNTCIVCEEGYKLLNENGKVRCVEECKDGKYSNGTECNPCNDPRCTGCSTERNCHKCEDGTFVFQEADCVPECKPSYVVVGQHCINCVDPYCEKCSSPNFCVKCKEPRTNQDGSCVLICDKGFTKVDETCVPCPNDCDHCPENPDVCVTCSDGKVNSNGICVDLCDDGSVPQNGICKECEIEHCKECYANLIQCKECEDGYKLDSKLNCVIDCPSKTYEKDGVCIPCNNCPECNSSGCTKCVAPLELKNGKCENVSCEEGKVLVNNLCVDCKTVDCKLCPNPNECYDCKFPKILDKDKNCVLECKVGEIIIDGKCVDCIKDCEKCYSKYECTICTSPLVKHDDGSCILVCNDGKVNIDGECIDCTAKENCKKCHPDNLEICIICRDGYFLLDKKCVHRCDDGTFVEDKGGLGYECKECPSNCAYCSVSTICDRCDEGYVLKDNVCIKIVNCDEGYVLVDYECKKCTSDRCLKCEPSDQSYCDVCKAEYFNYKGQCVIVCEDGTYANSHDQCVKCTDPKCEKCTNATTCIECKEGWVLYFGECRPNCPAGYTPNNLNECVPCEDSNCSKCKYYSTSICEECTIGFLDQNGKCVTDCGDGFYENNKTKKCTPCDVTCKTCENDQACINCELPAKLVDGKCVTECKDGEAKVGDKCVPCNDKDCLKCPSNPNICILCDSNTYLYKDECVTPCPEGTYASNGKCVNCNNDCNVCKSLSICNECKAPMFIYNNSCISECPPKTTKSGNTCVPCEDTDCLICSVPKTCEKCTNYIYKGDCVDICPIGTYPCPETKKCIDCIENCDKCSNTYKCEKCETGFLLQNDVCVEKCKEGYIADKDECKKCTAIDCLVCLPSDLSTCIKCKPDEILYEKICVDKCPSGFLPQLVSNVLTCVPCSSNCKECIQDPSKCIECNGTQQLQGNTCVDECPPGQVKIAGECKRCTDPKCENCNPNDRSQCYECTEDYVLVENQCVTECKVNQFRNDQTKLCEDCPINCKVCKSKENCEQCQIGYVEDERGICIVCVEPNQVIDGVCKPCKAEHCDKCVVGKTDTCEDCEREYINNNGICKFECDTGFYKEGEECKPCTDNCQICNNSQSCLDCEDKHLIFEGKCVTECPPHYVAVQGVCEKCTDADCLKCKAEDTSYCIKCEGNTILHDGDCITKCPTGYYFKDDKCNKCDEHCKSCIETKCDICDEGYFLKQGKCVKDCGDGQYEDQITGKCIDCTTDNCKECTPSGCVSCDSPLVLTLTGECKSVCDDGSYSVNGVCKPCETGCKKCIDDKTCIECNPPLYLMDGDCKSTCPDHHTIVDGKCVPCTDKTYCYECEINQPSSCEVCDKPKILHVGICVDECKDGTFYNSVTNTCDKCPGECEKCTSKNVCTDCVDGFYLNGTECVSKCPKGKVEVDDKCIDCQLDDCGVCKVASGGPICIKCDPPAIKNDKNECVIECPPGTRYYAEDNECLPCQRGCELCDGNGDCVHCKKSYFLENKTCKTQCADGFIGNCDKNLCEKCHPACKTCIGATSDKCVECADKYLFQGEVCVYKDNCHEGFYPDTLNGQCSKCTQDNCKTCINSKTCTACDERYTLKEGKCIRDFDIKPILTSSVICSPNTPTNYGPIVIKDKDIGSPLHGTKDLTVSTVFEPLGITQNLSAESVTSIITLVNENDKLTIIVGVDRADDSCAIFVKHDNSINKVNAKPNSCSDEVSTAHIIGRISLIQDTIKVNIIVSIDGVTQVNTETFQIINVDQLSYDGTFIISDESVSSTQGHLLSNVFVSASYLSDEIANKIASTEPLKENSFSCRNAEKCKEDLRFYVLTNGLVPANTPIELDSTTLVRLSETTFDSFRVETVIHNLRDGAEVKIDYPYEDVAHKTDSDAIALALKVNAKVTEVQASNGVITIPEIIEANWVKLIISINNSDTNTVYSVEVKDFNGKTLLDKEVTNPKENDSTDLFNDAVIVSNKALEGIIIHIGTDTIKEVLPFVQQKKDDFQCKEFDQNLNCITCADGYTLNANSTCQNNNHKGCEEAFDFVQILSNEIHEIEVKEDTLLQAVLTLVIKIRKTSHAILKADQEHSLVSLRSGAVIIPLLTEKNTPNYDSIFRINGQDNATVNYKNNSFEYIEFIVKFSTATKTGSAYLVVNGIKQPEVAITYKDFTKIVLGDVSKDQINAEFRTGLICKEELSSETINKIVNESNPSVDFACLNANYATGECLECLNSSHPTDPTKCSHSVVGFTNEHITTIADSVKEEERYITDLRTINRNVSSESYLITSRFTIHEIPEDGRYNIIKLENHSTDNTEDTPLHLFSLNVVFSQSIGTVEAVFNTATDGKIVSPINHVTVNPGEFIFISVEFNSNKDFVKVITNTEDVGTKVLEITAHNIELLQYYATLSIFGVKTPQEEKPFIAEVAHCYIVSNLREDSTVAQVFLEDTKFTVIKPVNQPGCLITSIDKECLLCENNKENINGRCLDSVAIVAQEKGYSIITEGIVTEAAVSHTINNPFLTENEFNIAFYVQLNTVKYDAVDKIIDLGSIKLLYVENEGTITIRFIVNSKSIELGPYVLEQVQTWLSFTISIQTDKVYIYIREASGVILDSTIVNESVAAPSTITVQNLDNSKYVANIHLIQENYSKPVLPAPEEKSIQCDLVVDRACVSRDEDKPIEIYNFAVTPANAPHVIDVASIIRPDSGLSSDSFTIEFSFTIDEANTTGYNAFISIVKVNFGVNYIELKTDKDTQTSYSLELKTFYSTMKEAHKEIVTIELPSEKDNVSTSVIISVNQDTINVLIYDSATNYVKSTTEIKGNLDFVTPSTKFEFGESKSSSKNKYLSIRDLSIDLENSLTITELFNEAVELTETIQEACVARDSNNAVCTKCETSYKLITDNNGDETCVPVGESFAYNTKLVTEVTANSPYNVVFPINQSIENFTVSINIESITTAQVIDITSVSLDSKEIVQVSVDGDKLVVENTLSEKTIEINNVFDCSKAKPFENIVIQVDIINGVTSVTIYDKMIEDTITEKSFGKSNSAIRALNLNVSQTSNSEVNYKSGAVTASVNTSESLNSDDVKLLAINHLNSNNSCRGDLTSDEYQLCNLKNNSAVDINNSSKLFSKLGSVIPEYSTHNFNPKFQINTKFDVDQLQNSSNVNKNVVFAVDNSVSNSVANSYTQNDILSEATEGSCRLTLTAINDRLTLVTSLREIEVIDQSHNLSDYSKIEVYVSVDTVNHTIEVRTQADEVTIKQVITGVFEVQPVSSNTSIFKNPEVEATISLSENPKPSEVIDCESFKVKQDHCNIDNCLGCLLDQEGKKRCLKCETGYSLLPDSKKCSKSTLVLEKSFIAKP